MLVMISLGRLPDARAVACRACAVRIASRTTREIGIPTCRSRAAMRASSGARRTFRSFTSVIVKTPCLYVKHRAPTAAFAGAPRWCACRYPSASAHGQEADKLVGPRSSAAGRPLQSSARYGISVEMAGSTGFEPATSGLTDRATVWEIANSDAHFPPIGPGPCIAPRCGRLHGVALRW